MSRRARRRYYVCLCYGWWSVWDRLTDSVAVKGIDTRSEARRTARMYNDWHEGNRGHA